MKISTPIVIALSLLALVPSAYAQGKCENPSQLRASKTGHQVAIELDLRRVKQCLDETLEVDPNPTVRVDEDDTVLIRVRNVNFVLYTMNSKVDETVVESYVLLEKLWSQLLGFPGVLGAFQGPGVQFAAAGECSSFGECLARWAYKIVLADLEHAKFRQQHLGHVTLSPEQAAAVETSRKTLLQKRVELRELVEKLTVDYQPVDLKQVNDFETVRARYDALLEKIGAYEAAADLVRDGQVVRIAKKKGGTIVSVTLTPVDRNKVDAKPVTIVEYFVNSRLPLTMHVGYTYSKVREVKFETVRSLAQADLFAKVRDDDNTNSMVAFLSLGRAFFAEKAGVYVSLGTDFSKPGERLYAGLTVQLLKRFMISFGKVSASQEVGENPVLERVGEATGSRELFSSISTHRDWKAGFGAISFRVF